MSRTSSRRLLTRAPQSLFAEFTATSNTVFQCRRQFSYTVSRRAEDIFQFPPKESTTPPASSDSSTKPSRFGYGAPSVSPSINPKASPGAMGRLAQTLDNNSLDRQLRQRNSIGDPYLFDEGIEERPPHQLHVYATKHNCHITLWGPPKSVGMNKKKDRESFKGGAILSISAGQIGFKHSGRKHYDSAFQLASYAFARMAEAGVSQDITQLELYLRGFGAGREAVTKALLGSEGKLLRNKVIKVADTTKLKFGGTRSPKPRRLG